MYISMYGCDAYPSGMYVAGTNDVLKAQGVPKMYRCTEPKAQPGLAAAYWVLFIMICSFVMLSLFIGVITIAMSVRLVCVCKAKAKGCLTSPLLSPGLDHGDAEDAAGNPGPATAGQEGPPCALS